MSLTAFLSILLLLALLLYWELSICEGAHLGRRFVVWLYDLTSPNYNRIKEFDLDWEKRFLGEPVAHVIGTLEGASLLDVGAGTGRLAWALAESGSFHGRVTALEAARGMMARRLTDEVDFALDWVEGWATPLPFGAGTFDLVASLEVLEFTPNPRATLAELVRVLRPGGWLLVTNRIGWQAPLILGRTFPKDRFKHVLEDLDLVDVEVFPWQHDYDLAWARKPAVDSTKEHRIEAAALS